jgi:hypothetical protein
MSQFVFAREPNDVVDNRADFTTKILAAVTTEAPQ